MYFRYIKRLFIALCGYALIFLCYYEIIAWLWQEYKFSTPYCKRRDLNIPRIIVNVGVLLMATGKYAEYISPFVDAGRTFFLSWPCSSSKKSSTIYRVTYFVFTDRLQELPGGNDIVPIFQKRLFWPLDSMMRCSIYVNATSARNKIMKKKRRQINSMDYLFSIDSDVRFVRPVGEEMMGNLVGTVHPGYVGEPGKWDRNPNSTAFVAAHEGVHYYTGAVFGGNYKEFIQMCRTIDENVKTDMKNNVLAVWHDESHINKYFISNPPSRILSPLHYWPEEWDWNFSAKLLALRKVHSSMRSQ